MTILDIFDVEHGQCVLLTDNNGRRMMIDCGHSSVTGWCPGNYLRALRVNYLDMLVVTNYDQDHISGFPNLLSQVTIGNIVRNTSITPHEIYGLKTEDGIASAAMTSFVSTLLDFGPPGAGASPEFYNVSWHGFRNIYPDFDDENNLSLVLVLNIHGIQFMFPGDMEYAGWLHLLRTNNEFAKIVSGTHVLMASHHGRDNGICPELFDVYGCAPQVILISDDYRKFNTQFTSDYYQTKASGVLFRGEERKVITTRRDGHIRFEFYGYDCHVV